MPTPQKDREFRLEYGSIYLYERGQIVTMYESEDPPAFAYAVDPEDRLVTMHKFGKRSSIEKWLREKKQQFAEAGTPDLFGEFGILSSEKWEISDLNAILENPYHIRKILESLGMFPGQTPSLPDQTNG